MDSFSYYDIFQTKGIEYLIIIAFLLMLIPFWRIINRKGNLVAKFQETLGSFTSSILNIPKGVFYCTNHTWAFMEKSGIAQIGIDDWLLHLMGESELVLHKAPGVSVKKGELMAEIKNQDKCLSIYAPISGTIVSAIELAPNEHPKSVVLQTEGRLFNMEPTHWKAETKSFLLGDEAKSWINSEIQRLKDFLAASMVQQSVPALVVLQEGGELKENLLPELSGEVWQNFQKEFLENQQE
ncbi:MAG TPA: hypothetical protein DCQ26_15935 [Marinilabiliales bacterium]|nr:MAG: hypothetical protein A2W96_08400 [Bacteroidetes bacterium GWD2_40_43]OFX93982.1 MAG: hypothetical protein A2W97_14325 [Bacteroidetes bacterium GWE2_40_63]OFY19771.1 MAG: hypothetical protein A2W88_03195 [Bacteroidetes bacterium GWF2_40_13]OFZ28182.1 MAG: hypothetical protein A2437_04695 [Bacteroidetes bacterium RIFOXYC2_FULL_40_12]HAN00089.1 hypothetical protein [Marinilabiliales bacterium]